jgi:hypothetical protein
MQRDILEFLDFKQEKATKIFLDSASGIDLCNMIKMTHKTGAIYMRINFIRKCINDGLIVLHFVPSHLNVADLLTKTLVNDVFKIHVDNLQTGISGSNLEKWITSSVMVVNSLILDHLEGIVASVLESLVEKVVASV